MAVNEKGANEPVTDGTATDDNGKAGNGAPLTWFQQPGFIFKNQKRWLEVGIAAAAVFMLTRMR